MSAKPLKRSVPVVGAALGGLGAAGTAIAASLCCVGPAVVTLLGASGAVAVAQLEPYRPYILAVGAIVVAFGYFLAYRPGGICKNGICSKRATRFVKCSLWISTFGMALAVVLFYRF